MNSQKIQDLPQVVNIMRICDIVTRRSFEKELMGKETDKPLGLGYCIARCPAGVNGIL